jgi:membrane protein DedA with SNARE-associated domain
MIIQGRLVVGLLLLGFVLFIIIDTTTNGYLKVGIKEFLEWIEDHPIGGMFLFMVGTCMCRNNWCSRFVASAGGMVTNICTLYVVLYLVYFISAVLFIPASILTLGAGFVFASAFGLGGGIILGTLSVFIGASLGAIASFLLGRYLLRDFVHRLTKKYTIFEALDVSLQQNGLKIFLLLRLSPIIPFNVINYIGGVSAASFRDYVLATQAVTSCLGLSSS